MKNNLVRNEPWLQLAVESGWQIQVDEIILNIIDEFGKPIINDNGKKMRFYPMRECE